MNNNYRNVLGVLLIILLTALAVYIQSIGTILSQSPIERQKTIMPIMPDTVDEDTTYEKAVDHLKYHEGFRATVYYDVDGSKTIGYGHHLLKNENYTHITESKATSILKKDLQVRMEYVEDKYDVGGDTLLALTLFSFNLGTGGLDKAISKGLLDNPDKLLQYCHYRTRNKEGVERVHTSKRLLARRKYELRLITKN